MGIIRRSSSSMGSFITSNAYLGSDDEKKSPTKSTVNWSLLRQKVGKSSRVEIVTEILSDIANADPVLIMDLGVTLQKEGWGTKLKTQSSKYLYVGTLLVDWAIIKGVELETRENITFQAKSHSEVWRTSGIEADGYNLRKSRELYGAVMKTHEDVIDLEAWLDFSRVLQYIGDLETASKIVNKLMSRFEKHTDFPSFLFYAGGLLKALGDFDRAGSYFFESMSIGPPKLFSRLDMMFIVARTLEESTQDSDDPVEDGYRMVHHHQISDGLLPDSDFYDWINDSSTWRSVADKCAVVGVYSLAADLYGQGVIRDPNAFRRSRLWLGFGKASFRCGKMAEAQLALRQALAIDPHNVKVARALKKWEELSLGNFETLLNDGLEKILNMIPAEISITSLAASRLQAMIRGRVDRSHLHTGHGKRGETRSKLRAKVCLIISRAPLVPLLIQIVSDWQHSVKSICVLDVRTNLSKIVKFKNPIAPIRGKPVSPVFLFLLIYFYII